MRSPNSVIRLTEEELKVLRDWTRRGKTEHRLAERARILLLAHEGHTNKEIAERLETRTARVSKWRQRFGEHRIAGLNDAPRSGKPAQYDRTTEKSVLTLLDQSPPKGYSQWNGNRVAEALPGVSKHQVAYFAPTGHLFAAPAELVHQYRSGVWGQSGRRGWPVSHPPENALVLSIDEKPSIQALERAQGYLRLPDGKAVNGYSHGYQRHGTTTLFAALEITTGWVKTAHYQRRRRREFLDFMNEIVAGHPGREIHVVLDNLNTHKPKDDRWLKRHPNVHFHFIPTYSSWLNQVECWFSILAREALRGASFTSPEQVRQAIDDFVAVYNPKAAPFEWKKAVVFPSAPKQKYSDLRN